jgi:hypothetical protein
VVEDGVGRKEMVDGDGSRGRCYGRKRSGRRERESEVDEGRLKGKGSGRSSKVGESRDQMASTTTEPITEPPSVPVPVHSLRHSKYCKS